MFPWELVEASTEVDINIWEFPLMEEVEASITSINCVFHDHIWWKLQRASTYPYTLPPRSTSFISVQQLTYEFTDFRHFHKGS